jgi:hypothetical protein
MMKLIAIALMAGACIAQSLPALAQTEIERERHTLRGLPDFQVVVNIEGPSLVERERDLNVRRVTSDIERRLREAGVPVRPGSAGAFPRGHYLYIHINIMDAGEAVHPFAIEMGMHQPVSLSRDPSIQSVARTWHGSAVGYFSGHMSGGLQEAAAKLLANFIEDYNL